MTVRQELAAGALTDLLFDEPGAGRCLVAPDGSVLRANAEWLRSTGLSLDDVLGADIIELFPGTRDMALALHARARAGHRVEVPRRAQRVDGRETWCEGSIAPVPMENGTGLLITTWEVAPPAGVSAPAAPGSERVRGAVERQLEAVERLYAITTQLIEADDVEVLYERILDTAVAVMRADCASIQMLDRARGELVLLGHRGFSAQAAKFWQWVRPTSRSSCGRALQTAQRIVVPDVDRCDWMEGSDDVKTFHEAGIRAVQTTPLLSRDGTAVIGMISTHWREPHDPGASELRMLDVLARQAADLIDRKRTEQALRESEQRYRTMGETLPYGVWLCDAGGRAQYVSQSFLDLLEMTHDEMRDFGWTHRLPPEDVEPMLDRWLHCVRTGAPWDSEHRVLGPDGKYHHVLTRGLPVRDDDGRITCWVGINLDIDKRKAMEEDLREADRRKTEFLAMLSHELRSPLAPIRNSIYLLERVPPGSEQAARAKEVVRRQTEHLTRLVDDLLDITRISRGKIALQRTRVDLREIVRKTTDDLHSVFAQAGVGLRVGYVTAGPLWVDADATRMAQVLTNLLQNAVKFTPSGGTVFVTVAAEGETAELCVRDTGSGMDPETIEHMFEPFAQADQSLARTQGGLGLGLALVKAIVDMHGGSVRARSEGLGHGAEFRVHVPRIDSGAESGHERVARTQSGALTILVIEDNLDAGQSLADILELDGHHVRLARDGTSGAALARELRPDFVLCDIGLPDIDGYQVARTLRRDDALRDTRLVAVSGYAQPGDRQRASEAGFDAHLAKPPDVDELKALLASKA